MPADEYAQAVPEDLKRALKATLSAWADYRRRDDQGVAGMYYAVLMPTHAAMSLLAELLVVAGLTAAESIRLGEIPEALTSSLAAVSKVTRAHEVLDRDLDTTELILIHRARSLGATWSQIGESVGMSPQGAFKKFASRLEPLDNSVYAKDGPLIAQDDLPDID